MRSRWLALVLMSAAARAQLAPEPATVRVGVLSLFHTKALVLTSDRRITLLLDGAPRVLDARHAAAIQVVGDGLLMNGAPAQMLTVASGDFTLSVPGKLTRAYRGGLTVESRGHVLSAIVTMDTELAVSSIVAAESPPHAALEALKAQAVASRSFLLANGGRHVAFDGCDTTHCQYLRSPPVADSPAALATRATRGLVLSWRPAPDAAPRIVSAMYSRSCGGETRVPGGTAAGAYPFYSVRCEYCVRHPELWSRAGVAAGTGTERERLAYNREHGWSAIPSGTHAVSADGALEGRGTGHGVGLCQLGAADMAARGRTYEQILGYYFPNTAIARLP
jgi:stage II sporulation protein D